MTSASVVELRSHSERPRRWSNQELAELYRVAAILGRAGLAVGTECGVSDEGDPWFVFFRSDTGEVIAHFARIDGIIVAASVPSEAVLRGAELGEIVARLVRRQPLVIPNVRGNDQRLSLHPSVVLTAFVATAYYLSGGDNGAVAPAARTASAGGSDGGLSFAHGAALASVLAIAATVVEAADAERHAVSTDSVELNGSDPLPVAEAADAATTLAAASGAASGDTRAAALDGRAPPAAQDEAALRAMVADSTPENAPAAADSGRDDAGTGVDDAMMRDALALLAGEDGHGGQLAAGVLPEDTGVAPVLTGPVAAAVAAAVEAPASVEAMVSVALTEIGFLDNDSYYLVSFDFSPRSQLADAATAPLALTGSGAVSSQGSWTTDDSASVSSGPEGAEGASSEGSGTPPAGAFSLLDEHIIEVSGKDAEVHLGPEPSSLIYEGGNVAVVGFDMGTDRLLIEGHDQAQDKLIVDWTTDGNLVLYVGDKGSITFVGLTMDELAHG